MIAAAAAVACGLAAAAWSVTMLRGYVAWGCIPGRELRAAVAFAVAVALVLVVPPAALSFIPGHAAAPAWTTVLFAGVWLTLFVAFLGLNGEEVRDAPAAGLHAGALLFPRSRHPGRHHRRAAGRPGRAAAARAGRRARDRHRGDPRLRRHAGRMGHHPAALRASRADAPR
jgi:hypothetical protein